MAEETFVLFTRGDIAPGRNPEEVRARLQELCKYRPETLERVFSGEPFRFKSGLDRAAADKYRAALERTGIVCHLRAERIAVSQTVRPRDPEPGPPCPSCGAPQSGGPSCAGCGIVFEKFRRQQQQREEAKLLGTSPHAHAAGRADQPARAEGSGTLGRFLRIAVLGLALALVGYVGYRQFSGPGDGETVIFTTDGCAPCDQAKDFLASNEIAFSECNIAASEENRKKFDRYRSNNLPLAFIAGERLEGFHPSLYGIAVAGLTGRRDGTLDDAVVMYSAPGCRGCSQARAYFAKHDISYTDFDISDPARNAEYLGYAPFGTPLILVGGIRVDGYNEAFLEMALRQAGLQ